MKKLRTIKNNELYYNGYSLVSLAEKYHTPLKITFLDVIKEHILSLKETFNNSIKELNYQGKFIYLNANKANYGSEEILQAFKVGDGLETSSYYDLLYTYEIFKKYPKYQDKYIVCNGYKLDDYLDTIKELYLKGYHIIDIIDSLDEYNRIKEYHLPIEIGLRIHLFSKYLEPGDEILNDRFGLNKEEFEYIMNDLKNTSLNLTTIHFHQRGFDFEKEPFEENFLDCFNNYYVSAAKKYNTIINFDIGGGTPLPIEEGFDYDDWSKYVLKLIQKTCKENHLNEPNIISENGKFSQKDSTVNIYKIVGIKNTDEIPWCFVDGSMLIALPEMYALGEPILVEPINELDKPTKKVRIGGMTCDCDDVYPKHGDFFIPDTKEDVYIGLIGTGSYQNSMNGKGGVHHCLLPEETDIIIYTDESNIVHEEVRNKLQTIDDIMKLTKLIK